MTADLATIETGLSELFARLMEVPCDWRKKPRGMHVRACAQLDDLTSNGVGVDDSVWRDVDVAGEPTTVDADVAAVRETVQGIRERTLQVTVWSPRQTLAESARFYLERLRTRLRWSSSLDALRAIGVGLVGVEAIQLLDHAQDGRDVSEAAMDLRITHAVAEADEPVPFIERGHVTGSVESAGGEEIAALEIDLNPEP